MTPRHRARLAAIAAVALTVTSACGTTAGSTSAPTTASPTTSSSTAPAGSLPDSTSAPTATARTAPSASSPPGPCTNLSAIGAWPVARRAAQLIVAPVLNFDSSTIRDAATLDAGGILFLGNAPTPADLGTRLQEGFAAGRSGPTPFVMADQEGGGIQRLAGAVTAIPWARQMAASMTLDQVRQLAASVGRQMAQLGVTVDLAPVVDLDDRPGPSASNPDGLRSFSVVPGVASRYGVAFMEGLQSTGVLSVSKHFPGLGYASGNTDTGPAATQPIGTLDTGGLLPFRAAIAAGAQAIMVANASVPGLTTLPASLSSQVIDGLLRTSLDFKGLVLTDSLSAGAISQAGYNLPAAAVAAVRSGADMILFGSTLTPAETLLLSAQNVTRSIGQIVAGITDATDSGTLPMSALDDAVLHVLAAKHVNLCTS